MAKTSWGYLRNPFFRFPKVAKHREIWVHLMVFVTPSPAINFSFFFFCQSRVFSRIFFFRSGGGPQKNHPKIFFFAGASRVSAYLHGKIFQNREDMSKKGSKIFALRAKKSVHFT